MDRVRDRDRLAYHFRVMSSGVVRVGLRSGPMFTSASIFAMMACRMIGKLRSTVGTLTLIVSQDGVLGGIILGKVKFKRSGTPTQSGG